MSKQKLTVTVDREIAAAGLKEVELGRADSLSSWVNEALAERVAKERRLQALGEAIDAYESQHGSFTPAELAALQRKDAERAIVVRGPSKKRATPAKTSSKRGAD